MRTLAMIGAGAIATLISVTGAFAWTQEQPAKSSGGASNAVDLSDNDAFQALQDKVNGKTPSSGTGFQVYGGTVTGSATTGFTGSNPYSVAPMSGRASAFSYSPNPGFRGQGD
jgi:hypothetical protein